MCFRNYNGLGNRCGKGVPPVKTESFSFDPNSYVFSPFLTVLGKLGGGLENRRHLYWQRVFSVKWIASLVHLSLPSPLHRRARHLWIPHALSVESVQHFLADR